MGFFDAPWVLAVLCTGIAAGAMTVESPDAALPAMADLEVVTWGPRNVSPGQTIDYVVEYRNQGVTVAGDVVVIDRLPTQATYVSSTAGGIYIAERHEVLWKLGSVAPGTNGLLTARVRIAWGLAGHSTFPNGAYIGTGSAEVDMYRDAGAAIPDLDYYLGYGDSKVLSVQYVDAAAVSAELAVDPQLADLFAYAGELLVDAEASPTTTNSGSPAFPPARERSDTG